ncbi:MAG: sel1 repeat family protein [bacterium]|nr:sel1 repeat family protein [bacterium]
MSQYKKICPECGTAFEIGEYFCPSCRHECPDNPKLAEVSANPLGTLVFGGLAILIILGFFGGFAFLAWDDTNSSQNRTKSVISVEKCSKLLTSITSFISLPDLFKKGVYDRYRTDKPLDTSAASALAKAAEESKHNATASKNGRELFMQGTAYHARGNYPKAMECWRSAAKLGDAEAMYNIGSYYYNGISIPQNEQEAYKWFMLAANAGFAQAQFAVGGMHMTGVGTYKNIEEGKRWFRMAASQGHQQAAAELKELESSGSQNY